MIMDNDQCMGAMNLTTIFNVECMGGLFNNWNLFKTNALLRAKTVIQLSVC
jgi:hypothetical protein